MPKEVKRPRNQSSRQSTKVPLTYYRSAPAPSERKDSLERKNLMASGPVRQFFARLFSAAFLLILLVGIIFSLLVSPKATVLASSTVYHSKSTYQAAAQKLLSSLADRNKITLDQQAFSEAMQKQFPEIANVYLELPIFSQKPLIHLKISDPSFVLNNSGRSFIVDSQGLATSQVGNLKGYKTDKLAVVTDNSGFIANDGEQVMSASSVAFINSLIAQLQHAGIPIKSLSLPQQPQELDLQTTDRPYYVKFYLGGDVLQQTGQYLATRHYFDTNNNQPKEYLDVRVGGKVFYK